MTYGHKDKKNAHIKLMIWHNIMTFKHNDQKNARNKLVVGYILLAFGRNDKKNAHSKLMIQHNTMVKDDSIITLGITLWCTHLTIIQLNII